MNHSIKEYICRVVTVYFCSYREIFYLIKNKLRPLSLSLSLSLSLNRYSAWRMRCVRLKKIELTFQLPRRLHNVSIQLLYTYIRLFLKAPRGPLYLCSLYITPVSPGHGPRTDRRLSSTSPGRFPKCNV